MENVVSLRGLVKKKMALHLGYFLVHGGVGLDGDVLEDGFEVGNVALLDVQRKCLPVENIAEREHEAVSDDHRHTFVVDGFHNPGAVHLVSSRTYTKPAPRLHTSLQPPFYPSHFLAPSQSLILPRSI